MITKDQILDAIKFNQEVLREFPDLIIAIYQDNIQLNRSATNIQLYEIIYLVDRYHRGDVLIRAFNKGAILFYNGSGFELDLNKTLLTDVRL